MKSLVSEYAIEQSASTSRQASGMLKLSDCSLKALAAANLEVAVIVFEIRCHHVVHQSRVTLRHRRGGHAELRRYLLALETLYEHHLQDKARLAVAPQLGVAKLENGLPHLLLEVVVDHVEAQGRTPHALLKALGAPLPFSAFQLVEQHETEAAHHPRLERHAG